MNPHLDDDAQTFGDVAASAFAAAGGVDLARRAEAEPGRAPGEAAVLLDRLGIGEVDPRTDAASAEAAAALCRAAGAVVLPHPVVPTLLDGLTLRADRPTSPERSTAQLGRVDEPPAVLVDHAAALASWRISTIGGDAVTGVADGVRLGTRLGPFVGGVTTGEPVPVTPEEIALHLTLTGFVIVGALTAALDLATAHVVDRVQFDKPLASFQAVQFQLADAHVAIAGVEEVVQFALWRCHVAPDAALADALAARLAALDAARSVLRITQQLHGASGVCDEYDVSTIARHLQAALRLPFGSETTADAMATAVAADGFVGLFDHHTANETDATVPTKEPHD